MLSCPPDAMMPPDAPMPPVPKEFPAVLAAAPKDVASDDGVLSSSSSSSSSSSASPAVIEEDAVAPAPYVGDTFVGAYFIKFDEYVDLVRPARSHTRYLIRCLHHGGLCAKRRGVGPRQELRHGRIEPLALCLAWAQQAERSPGRAEHASYLPTDAEIDIAIGVLRDQGII